MKEILESQGFSIASKTFINLQIKTPRVFARQIDCENVIGDYLVHAKNCFRCFNGREVEDSMYQDRPLGVKDSVDCSHLYQNCELNYMVMSAPNIVNVNFSFSIDFCHDCEYCMYCFNSQYLFGCIGKNHAEYEILNMKYSKDEWFKRVREIKEQMKKDGTYGKMFESDYPIEDSIVGE